MFETETLDRILSPLDVQRTKEAEEFLENIARAIQISDSRYEEAINRYKSVSSWLRRPESKFKNSNPEVSLQGSFKLGTVIRPVLDDEEYDVDLVCEVNVDRNQVTQEKLKNEFGSELLAYAKAKNMEKPESHRRCWRLNYTQEAQFHMDVLPSVPNGSSQKEVMRALGFDNEFVATAIAITDDKHPKYRTFSLDWLSSNPQGYATWFYSRMAKIFNLTRQVMAVAEKMAEKDIPDYKIKTPLQSAIQILKRHRDMTHEGEIEDRPISIIITTLAAHAYQQENTISGALYSILSNMERFVENRNGVDWVANPTDPRENFADKWAATPQKKEYFYSWLEKAKKDFIELAQLSERQKMAEVMAPALGLKLVEKAVNETSGRAARPNFLIKILNPEHRKPAPWTFDLKEKVKVTATRKQFGFRTHEVKSDGPAVTQNATLYFKAETNIPEPYEVYWQIVNTGDQAKWAGQLRGGFDFSTAELGKLIRKETTRYKGSHSVECFIVKNDVCLARSGQFVVNIQ